MMKNNFAIKIVSIFTLVIIICLSFMVKVGADVTNGPAVNIINYYGNSITISKAGDKITLGEEKNKENPFKINPKLYCIQSGRRFDPKEYTASEYHVVTDPILEYILNLEDKFVQYRNAASNHSEKQHLIWHYIKDNPYETKSEAIASYSKYTDRMDLRGVEYINGEYTTGYYSKGWKLTYKERQTWDKALKYKDKVNEFGKENLNLDIQITGNDVKVEWNKIKNAETYRVYINGSDTPLDNLKKNTSGTNIIAYIPFDQFTGGVAKIKVKAIMNGFGAGYYKLFHPENQNLMCINNYKKEIERSAEGEKFINSDISLQKYIIGTIDGDGSGTTHISDTSNSENSNLQGETQYVEEQREVTHTETVEKNTEFENFVIIGDNRIRYLYNDISNSVFPINKDEENLTIDGKNIKFYADKSGGTYGWFTKDSSELERIKKTLTNLNYTEKKSKCIICIGLYDESINQPDAYIQEIINLANTYKNIEFYINGIGYVNENISNTITNSEINNANNILKSALENNQSISNLHYVDFNELIISIMIASSSNQEENGEISDTIGNLIQTYDELIRPASFFYYSTELNTEIWNQVFSEGIVKEEEHTWTETVTNYVPVTDTSNDNSNYTPTGRENRYAVENDGDLYYNPSVIYNHKNTDKISNFKNRENVSDNAYKKGSPVEIEAGDSVVYKIEVYNNKRVDSEVTISDDFQNLNEADKIRIVEIRTSTAAQYENATKIKDLDKKEFNTSNPAYDGVRYWYDTNNQNNKFRFNLAGGTTRYIYITIKYDKYTTEVLRNRTWVSTTTPENMTGYRTIDADYIKMKTYAVSLEKFVYKVNNYEPYDFDNNSRVSIADVTLLEQYIVNQADPNRYSLNNIVKNKIKLYGDIDGNGQIDTDDINKLRNIINLDDYYIVNFFDFNGDGKIDVNDVTLLEKYIINQTRPNTYQFPEVELNKLVLYGDIDKNGKIDTNDKEKLQEYIGEIDRYGNYVRHSVREGYAEHNYDNDTQTKNDWKRKNVVTVSKGDSVTYRIKLINNGDTSVNITKVTDFFPNGVQYGDRDAFNGNKYDIREIDVNNGVSFVQEQGILDAKSCRIFEVTVNVEESNMSLNTLKNTATITEMKNKNNIIVTDTTLNDNTDSDYIQLKDVTIAGMVWNDKKQAKDNNQYDYNKLYRGQGETEDKLSGIVVKLYRNGINTAIATKTTDGNGNYYFEDEDIDQAVINNAYERHIKGSRVSNDVNRWAGEYYAYHIEFEYDGITYTSTPNGKSCVRVTDSEAFRNGEYKINSNAKEDFNTRKNFNDKFNLIKNNSLNSSEKIDYRTKNESGYIPQSVHNYKSFMKMKSSTETIQLANNSTLEEEIKYINLGLRGRDLFDLELTSDVAKVDVSVNGINQSYEYSNIVTVRRPDLNANTNVAEDMANIVNEKQDKYIYEYKNNGQKIRNTDKKYLDYVYVTYKITVKNTSKTNGTATKIINYYDNIYKFERAYSGNNNLSVGINNNGGYYKSVIINTPETILSENANMDIYVVYRLEDISILKSLGKNEELPTYNMAEIYEYKTIAKDNNNEFVRGLIDKDSAPGSANIERARTTDVNGTNKEKEDIYTTSETNGNPTTVNYYFSHKNHKNENPICIDKLKYEDDMFATPTFYFIIDGYNTRHLTGYVFEDKSEVNSNTKIKTGNGIYSTNDGDKKIYGATVKLEVYKEGTENEVLETYTGKSVNNNGKTIDGTNEKGSYIISGFIPGKAKLTFEYGNKIETVLIGKNTKSYNGEDFESTNNKTLDSTKYYWYLVNENSGKSVAKENSNRRNIVSKNVTNSDELMIELNKARAGQTRKVDTEKIIRDTKMDASSEQFELTVEKSKYVNNKFMINNYFGNYEVINMNFGISAVPVTTIDLKTEVKELIITDSARDNVIASAKKELDPNGVWNGKWKITGNILAPTQTAETDDNVKSMLDISIEEEKLQGAHLKIVYEVSANTKIERDFKNPNSETQQVINGLICYVDNDLSYSSNSINSNNITNSNYWDVTTYSETQGDFKNSVTDRGEIPLEDKKYGSVDEEGNEHATEYTTILKAKRNNPLLNIQEDGVKRCDLVLEKILSASDNTLSQIMKSTVEAHDYNNKVEVTGINYQNSITFDSINADRVRTPNTISKLTTEEFKNLSEVQKENHITESWMPILPGINRYASAESDNSAIHPPTGNTTRNIVFYIIVILFTILTVRVILKKYVIRNN